MNNDDELFVFSCINARSLNNKSVALVDLFNETSLSIALITETWLTRSNATTQREEDLEYGENIRLIRKDRAGGRRGGGVAIAYCSTKVKLEECQLYGRNNKCEMVAAIGRDLKSNKQIYIISVYLPPSMGKKEVEVVANIASENISRIKLLYPDISTIIGGDLNGKKFSAATDDFPLIQRIKTGPTRKNKTLDIIYTDIKVKDATLLCPIESEEGIPSDHKTIVCTALLKEQDASGVNNPTEYFYTRPLTSRGREKFSALLVSMEWEQIYGITCSESADKLAVLLEKFIEQCFPLKRHKRRSKDPPWITPEVKRKQRQKNRTYKREGRSPEFYRQRTELDDLLAENKRKYMERVKEKAKQSGSNGGYFQAAKSLQSKEMPLYWCISQMFPHLSKVEIAEMVAVFFNSISDEYTPIDEPNPAGDFVRLEEYQIASRLKHCKKPKSQVYGDIPPKLVAANADFLAIPLCHIFNQSLRERAWPDIWKREIVNVIPKTPSPSNLGELRNLSCTPLFSKVFEHFVLEDLKGTVSLSKSQYGGVKGISTDHFLIDSWQQILKALEDPDAAASITSIDFQKAFNRMSHKKCVEALTHYGAGELALRMVPAFLYNRCMSVKIGDVFSETRKVNGGAPQGSLLGNFLFCLTTDCFTRIEEEDDDARIRHDWNPVESTSEESTEEVSEEDSDIDLQILRREPRRVMPWDTSEEEEEIAVPTQYQIDSFFGRPASWEEFSLSPACTLTI